MKKWGRKLLLFFIFLHPVLDVCATYCKIGSFSVSTILRPIFPLTAFVFLLIDDKKIIKKLWIPFLVYLCYCGIHLWSYHTNLTPFAYGGTLYEAEYLFHYGYLMFLMYLYHQYFEEDFPLIKVLLYMNIEILGLLLLSYLTGTSTSTYLEGFGNKGWFSSGGMLGGTMTISMCLFLTFFQKFSKKERSVLIITMLLMMGYLCFFLGTRVAFFGSLLLLGLAGYFLAILYFRKKEKRMYSILLTILFFIGGFFVLQYRTSRASYLDDLKDDILDPDTGEVIHVAYDILMVEKDAIKENHNGLNFYQQEAIVNLVDLAEKESWVSTDMRKQQLYYHTFLYKAEGFDLVKKLFGNGYLSNMGALTLEMEEIALWYNFGILGFLLFFGYFLKLAIEGILIGIKNFQTLDFEYLMLTSGVFYSFGVSFFSGHIFFHTSVMIVIVILFTAYSNKIKRMKEGLK